MRRGRRVSLLGVRAHGVFSPTESRNEKRATRGAANDKCSSSQLFFFGQGTLPPSPPPRAAQPPEAAKRKHPCTPALVSRGEQGGKRPLWRRACARTRLPVLVDRPPLLRWPAGVTFLPEPSPAPAQGRDPPLQAPILESAGYKTLSARRFPSRNCTRRRGGATAALCFTRSARVHVSSKPHPWLPPLAS
jgi:hypothetical protein